MTDFAPVQSGDVAPDFGAVTAVTALPDVVGALLTIALITAVGLLIICAVSWAIASGSGSWHTAARARAGVLVAVGGAALTGGALAWTDYLLEVGTRL